ncbi:MAG: hypothetical protein AAFQ79_08910 [Pseudomonadota bacterium]
MKYLAAAFVAATTVVALPADAACRIEGAKCLTAPQAAKIDTYEVGETLPRGKYQVLLNTEYYGLPATDGSFWYFKVDRRVLKVVPSTMVVLADVTREARRAVW